MPKTLRIVLVLGLYSLVGCAPSQPMPVAVQPGIDLITLDPNSTATSTPFQPLPATATSTPSATFTSTSTDVPTDTPTLTPAPPTDTETSTPTVLTPTPAPQSLWTQYTFFVNLAYSTRTLKVLETIHYLNTTGENLTNIVLAVEPNLWSHCFTLNSISEDSSNLTNYSLDGQKLTINLASPLLPQGGTTFSIAYGLSLPPKSFDKTFGYLSDQVDLTDWYPFVVPYSNGWVLHDTYPFGEHLVYDSANFEVNLQVDDPKVIIAASGLSEANGDWTRYYLSGARTFVFSASDQFLFEQSNVGPTVIRSYYFAGNENAGDAVLNLAKQAVALYGVKFAPPPYPSLSVVETSMSDGEEYDGLVFLATRFYDAYDGTGRNDLTTIGAHEIAHQWWFGLVEGDRAVAPWVDEAITVYSEELFYEYNYPHYGNWWWKFRVDYFNPAGYVDGSTYSFATFQQFVGAVYLNGAYFVQELRTRVGDPAFFAFLKDYANRYAHQRVSAEDFFSTLRLHTNTDFSDILRKYFKNVY